MGEWSEVKMFVGTQNLGSKTLGTFPANLRRSPKVVILYDQVPASHHVQFKALTHTARRSSSSLSQCTNKSIISSLSTHLFTNPHTPTSANTMSDAMNFSVPTDLQQFLADLDNFIADKITPLQHKDDNNRFFDHRREHARTDWDNGGLPRKQWEDLLAESRQLADEAGFYRLALPKQYGGRAAADGRGSNLWMAVIREHLASKGLGLFNDLQNEHSVVGNAPDVVMVMNYGNEAQKKELIEGRLAGKVRITFGLTEPEHGSDATHMGTRGRAERREGVDGWVLNGSKKWQTGMHTATHCFMFARTQGKDGEAVGVSCFVVPRNAPGLNVESYEW
jgi:alkylation response protein AidB-like acyl-CoA dehydrogenase